MKLGTFIVEQFLPYRATDNCTSGIDLSGQDLGRLFRQKSGKGCLLISLYLKVEVLYDSIVVSNDVSDHHIKPVIPLPFLLNI